MTPERERPQVGISDQRHSRHDGRATDPAQLARRAPGLSPEEQATVRTWLAN
jgi:hypothetical protein